MKSILENIIVFTGGGTGGHVYPNLALMPEFTRRGFKPVYVGGEGETVEKRLSAAANVEYYAVPTVKLVRSMSLKAIANNLSIPKKLIAAIKKARLILTDLSPVAVFSKGGFVSLPTVIAATQLNIPVFAHESDLTLGLANRIAARRGATIFKANPHSKFDGITVGMPLRDSLFGVERQEAARRLNLPKTNKNVLLVLGGSSGAAYLNNAVENMLNELTKRFFVLHVAGKKNYSAPVCSDYKCFEYAHNIEDFYAVSDVVLSRAGATAVYEISALEKRAVFVPLPKGVSRGDQIDNAKLAEEYGAIALCQDESFSNKLLPSLEKALSNPPMRAISADANGKIANTVYASLRRGELCRDKKL